MAGVTAIEVRTQTGCLMGRLFYQAATHTCSACINFTVVLKNGCPVHPSFFILGLNPMRLLISPALLTLPQPEWLTQSGTHLATFSDPLPEPAPTYSASYDNVMAWHDVAYGRHAWPLPRSLRPHPDLKTRAAVFAAALLEGKVVPAFSGEGFGCRVVDACRC